MDKKITLGGKERIIRNNALLPRKYRHIFGRDLIADMNALVKAFKKSGGDEFNTEVLENLTWLMLREAGEDVGSSVDEWLSTLDSAVEIYQLLPEVIELWGAGINTTSMPKKK